MVESLVLKGIFTVLVVLLGFGLSLWVLLSYKNSSMHRALFVLINLIVFYILFDYLSSFTSGTLTTIFIRLSYCSGALALGSFYYFSLKFPFVRRNNIILELALLVSAVAISFLALFTNLVVLSTQFVNWGVQINEGGMVLTYYTILIILLLFGFVNIVKKYGDSTKAEKLKIKYLLIGMAIFAVAQVIFTIILPSFGAGLGQYYYLGDYSMIVFCGLAAYAIVRHGLFDVRLAIVRSVTYSLVLATFAGIYLVIAYAISAIFNTGTTSAGQIVSGVATSLLLAFVFQPLKRFFDRITNRVFYKDNYNTDDFFARLNKTLSVTTDLRGLLERVSYEIATTLKAEQAFFFIYTNADGNYISAGTDNHNHLPKHDAILVEQKSQRKDNIISESSLDEKDPIRRMMISHRIGLILPLMQDSAVVGYLCLGEHLTSGYTNRDIKALNTLSDELIIAIQNALAVHEIREINATLQQRISNATKELRSKNAILLQLDKIKDEFVSMASHQLRTPLTSVKGYLSMVIEGDAGKITPSQKQLLDQAFMSSENMVHLINDFLNVSRIQSGKFIIDKTPVDLSKLVEEEVNGLRPNATARNMKLVYKKPKSFPLVDVDEGKMRQVVMNFADNAIYYSHENSSIIISLGVEGNEIVFMVKDTGIGVPKSEKDRLFAKFYRAANAKIQRPDGTGVGIYLAKKVIDASGGKIIFESVEGKGSTFGFRLPLKPIEPTPPTTTVN